MDTYGLLLLTVLSIVSIVIVAVVSGKNRKSSDSAPAPSPAPVPAPSPAPVPTPSPVVEHGMHKESEKSTVSAPAVVIFEDTARYLRGCPYCDGENALSAKRCRICGEKL